MSKCYQLRFLSLVCCLSFFSSIHLNGHSPDAGGSVLFCEAPSGVYFSTFGSIVDIWWSIPSGGGTYMLEIGTLGFEPGTGQAAYEETVNNNNSFGINSLNGGFTYEAYVRIICINGDTSSFKGSSPFFINPNCGDLFYDSGGPDGDYSLDDNVTIQICPDNPEEYVEMVFHELDFEQCCASAFYFDGDNFDFISNTNVEDLTLYSALPGTCIDWFFSINEIIEGGAGWEASINCITCPPVSKVEFGVIGQDHISFRRSAGMGHQVSWEVGLAGFVPGTGAAVQSGLDITNILMTEVDGLIGNTAYEIYFWNNCEMEISKISGPIAFTTAPNCGDIFYDPSGPDSNQILNETIATNTIICPDQTGSAVQVDFNIFDFTTGNSNSNFAQLAIIDDDNFDNQYRLDLLRAGDQPGSYTATNPTGCLTFQFLAVADQAYEGFEADVTCVTCPPLGSLALEDSQSDGVTISWFPTLNASDYEWEIGIPGFEPGNGESLFSGTNLSNNNFAQASGLAGNTLYEFYVRADCGGGEKGQFSKAFLFSTQSTCGEFTYDPGGPNDGYLDDTNYLTTMCLENPQDTGNVIFNVFNTESCCDFLSVYEGIGINDFNLISFFSGSQIPDPIHIDNPTGCITLAFESNNNGGGNGWEAYLDCPGVTSNTDRPLEEIYFKLFPNPTDGHTFIEFDTLPYTAVDLEVRNVTGQLLQREKRGVAQSNGIYLDLKELPAGAYFLTLKNTFQTGTRKLIVY